ncbi:UbiD family decarboxylase [Chloroflexota bacterium]
MIFNDLREFIEKIDTLGDCKNVDGADWDLEIGLITEWQASVPDNPLLLFDKIKGYDAGYRVAANVYATPQRAALALGISPEVKRIEIVAALKEKLKEGFTNLASPIQTESAPIKQNVQLGEEVDLLRFPVPKWHCFDGGRYIGTGHAFITKDPDEGWVNLGTYRVQMQDKNTLTVYTAPGRHGDKMIKKWWAKGLNAPVAVATGLDPILWASSHTDLPWGISEYDYAGGYRGKPIEVTKGITVDLPIPARAEIILEGEMVQGETREEGPFGEAPGYYAAGMNPERAIRVKAILHRDNPIIQGAAPNMVPSSWSLAHTYRRAANAWLELDNIVEGITGVWMQDYAGFRPLVISIKQQYEGHAKQAAMAALSLHGTGFNNAFVIVVDDDIDPSDPAQVFWAMSTRCDPEHQLDIIKGTWGTKLYPVMNPDKKKRREYGISTAIILACKPYEWIDRFPRSVGSSPEELQKIERKWGKLFK